MSSSEILHREWFAGCEALFEDRRAAVRLVVTLLQHLWNVRNPCIQATPVTMTRHT
jgi:hypothetical protein